MNMSRLHASERRTRNVVEEKEMDSLGDVFAEAPRHAHPMSVEVLAEHKL